MGLQNIISARQFDKKSLESIFHTANKIKSGSYNSKSLSGKIMATLFYEPSTRTRLSFESAMLRLGGNYIATENASEFSSASKGENLEDTIRIINLYSDVIVLRHSSMGASEVAAKYSKAPVINAGDGSGEHPTQALLDLYTIVTKVKKNNLTISMVGDLMNGRTIHSLCYLLPIYTKANLIFVAPKPLAIPNSVKKYLLKNKVSFEETESLEKSVANSDVIYQTRIQKERFVNTKKAIIKESHYERYFGKYIIDEPLVKRLKRDSIIMHPLPRVNEIAGEVDQDKRAIYFEQAENGLYIRMALLLILFDKLR